MKKTITTFLVCILIAGIAAQIHGQEVSGKKKSIIEKQVDLIFHEMIQAAEDIDYDKLNQGVDDRYNAGFIVNGIYFTRYDSLHNLMKSRYQGVSRQHLAIQKQKITVLSDKIVLLTATGDAKVELSSGNILNVKFFWSFVYEKIDNTWKVIYSHQSNDR